MATLFVAALAAALIFFVWFPDPFQQMLGGLQLFLLVTGCDLALGPLTSLVIYSSRKSRRALIFDYVVVGIVQLSAFIYGVYSVSQNRPAYVAFVKDRIEVISAGEIAKRDLDEAKNSTYGKLPYHGPYLVGTYVKPEDEDDAMWAAFQGRDVGVRPKFFVDYETQLDEVRARLNPLNELEKRHPETKPLLDEALRELHRPADDFGWLPVKHAKGFWTVLIERKTGNPAKYLPFDPY